MIETVASNFRYRLLCVLLDKDNKEILLAGAVTSDSSSWHHGWTGKADITHKYVAWFVGPTWMKHRPVVNVELGRCFARRPAQCSKDGRVPRRRRDCATGELLPTITKPTPARTQTDKYRR